METLQTSNVSVSCGNIKCPEKHFYGKFAITTLPFLAPVANADTGSLKSLYTLFDKKEWYVFVTHAGEI